MAMFGVTGRESYDALYDALNKPADVSALDREQAPGMLDGDIAGAAGTGVYRGLSRGASLLANVSTPFLTPVAKSIDDMFGSSTAEWLQGETDKANRALLESKLDPKTSGAAAQVLYGLGDVLTTVVSTGGNPWATGAVYGATQAQIGVSEGLDPMTALGKGAIEGAAMGVSVALPAAMSGRLAFRAATGAAINVGVGIPERASVQALLNARGYPEMARQYAPLDSTSIITELVLGATFGGLLGPRGRAPKLPPPEAIPPSAVDAALVSNQAKHAEIDTAPGIPTDTRSRQAHNDALNSAVESLVMGREVSVERILAEAGFTGKRPDFDALRVIADELEKAGANDIVAQVRALEAEARARGLVVDEDTIGSVVLSDKPVESKVAGAALGESRVKIGEDYVPTRLVLVEADEVQATMMKADNQFRDRTRVASEQQISDIAARLDAALLMDAPVMDYGAPVLAADGTVIGGNGRAAAIGLAYERGTAAGYRDALRAEFGDAVDTMQRPMVVRVLQRDVDVQKAAILSNEGGALRMSALEQAKVDAERLGDFRAFEFSEEGDVNLAANMPFIREWVGQMPQNQRAAIMDADGRLSAEGAKRLQNAVLYKAYGDSPTMARLVEATDPGSRNIAAALTRAAPAVADAREAIARGDLYPMGLHDDLVSAVEKLDGLRRDGLGVDDWVKQIDAFGDGMTAEGRLLVQFLDQNIRSGRAISDGIFGFYNRLIEAGDPKQGSMFEAAKPDKMRMLTLALEGDAPMYSRAMSGPIARLMEAMQRFDFLRSVLDRRLLATGDDFEIREVPVDSVRLLQTGEDYINDSSRETARRIASGEVFDARPEDVLPIRLDKDGKVLDGHHRHAAAVMNGEQTILALVPVRTGKGRILNLDDFTQQPMLSRADAAAVGSTAANLTAAFRAMFGRDADRLMKTGRVRVVQSVSDLPWSGHPADVGGMYWKGEAWVVADNTSLSQIRGRMLHEVGEHAGMEQMLGPELYHQVLDTVARKAETDPVFREARALAEARANRPEHVDAETLAYLVENAPELPIVRRILAAVRQWLYRTTGGRFVDLNQADLQMMAVASLRRYAREAEIAEKGGDAPWYMTLFHGTPNPFKPEADAPLGRLQWRFINTGEGAQARGYGHYLAQQEWIARTRYRDRLSSARKATTTIVNNQVIPQDLIRDYGRALLEVKDQLKGKSAGEIPFILRDKYGNKFDPIFEGKALQIGEKDEPAWNIGGRIVHEQMAGNDKALAMAASQVSSFGYARAKQTFENFVQLSREELARQELGAQTRIAALSGDTADAARAMINRGVDYERNLVSENEAALSALDDVTVEADPTIEKSQFRGKDSYVVNRQGNGFPSLKEAQEYAKTVGKQRVLRSDISAIRPEPVKGALYGKYIPDRVWDQMMIWDAPMEKQPKIVQDAFIRVFDGEPDPQMRAEDAYWLLAEKYEEGELYDYVESGDFIMLADMEIRRRRAPEGMDPAEFEYDPRPDEMASVILNMLGVEGHRFLDGETRGRGWDSPDAKFNVVLYSDDLGRVAWEAKEGDAEWVTANGRGRIYWKADAVDAADGGRAAAYMIEVDGKEAGSASTIEEATRLAEQALEGQLYSRTGDGANMAAPDPLEDTTLPDARALSAQADAEIATAQELSQGFLPAVECALRAGE